MLYTLTEVSRQTGKFGETVTCSATGVDGTHIPKATIYKKQKDGTEFPNFAAIEEGSKLEANAWTNPKGYVSLFPPRAPSAPTPKRSPAAITKAMETKAENISKAQDKKEEGIRISSTFRAAVDTVISLNADGKLTPQQFRDAIRAWRRWYWFSWADTDAYPPFEASETPKMPPTAPQTTQNEESINPDDTPF